ncbi:MAG: type III pantothenate kinase [Clostridia bacterium]
MLLTVDIGNSNIVFGVFEKEELINIIRVETYDELSWQKAIDKKENIDGASIVSVVPSVSEKMINYLTLSGVDKDKIKIISPLMKNTGIYFENSGVNPKELGADLFANAVANHHIFDKRVLSVDLGTASKFCVIEKDGLYRGTTIVPGMKIALDALLERAPLLPQIPFEPTEKIINNTTVPCLQSGIFFGYCSLVDGLIKKIKKEQGDLYVVLTGGIGAALHEFLEEINEYIPNLTLQGAQILYRM